jgi:pSer/pThr/pTyr-binding forkhead associated (FHA) protein
VRLRFRIRPPVTSRAAQAERTVDVDPTRGTLTLGREVGVDIPLPFRTISARHAELALVGDGWTLSDLGSANGTFLDGKRLRPGDVRPVPVGGSFHLADIEVVFEGPPTAEVPVVPESTATLARRLVNDFFGSVRPAEVARLLVEEGPDAGQELVLLQAERVYRVGRSSACDLVLTDDDASREHASFQRSWNGVEVMDLSSKNGVELEGERIEQRARVRDGQSVLVGSTRLRLDDPEDRYLRQMQEEAERPGSTLVSDDDPEPETAEEPPSRRRRGASVAPSAIAGLALAVLLAVGGLALWLILGGER